MEWICVYHYQLYVRLPRDNTSVMGGSVRALSTKTGNESTEKTMPAKTRLKSYRQKLKTIKARIKYREHTLKGFNKHLKNGSFQQRMKSIKPYPKMSSPEAQAIVNAACDTYIHTYIHTYILYLRYRKK